MTPVAVFDLTEMVRVMLQRPERSPIFRAWKARAFVWVISEQMLTELREVTERPRFQRLIRFSVREFVLDALQTRAVMVNPATVFPHCRDPKDDIVVATAVTARPCYLVTSDRDLYEDEDLLESLRELQIQVMQPYQFLQK